MFGYLNDSWYGITSFFANSFLGINDFSKEEKFIFVLSILKGQDLSKGFAIRHVDKEQNKKDNIANGFCGDAISYSITSVILSEALNTKVHTFVIKQRDDNNLELFVTNGNNKLSCFVIDEKLACRIFDIMHAKVLDFISSNFIGNSHHFMLIKDMQRAVSPYDFETYPTGKCGKQPVKAAQIVGVFSKSNQLSSPLSILREIELSIVSPTINCDESSTAAVSNVL